MEQKKTIEELEELYIILKATIDLIDNQTSIYNNTPMLAPYNKINPKKIELYKIQDLEIEKLQSIFRVCLAEAKDLQPDDYLAKLVKLFARQIREFSVVDRTLTLESIRVCEDELREFDRKKNYKPSNIDPEERIMYLLSVGRGDLVGL